MQCSDVAGGMLEGARSPAVKEREQVRHVFQCRQTAPEGGVHGSCFRCRNLRTATLRTAALARQRLNGRSMNSLQSCPSSIVMLGPLAGK